MRTCSMTMFALLVLVGAASLTACSGDVEWGPRLDAIISDSSLSAEQRIERLQDYLDEGPPDEQADQARFTIGWLYSESLHQYKEARRWFAEVVENDPDGKWADDSQWMIDNMEKDPADLLPELQKQEAGKASPPPGGPGKADPRSETGTSGKIPPSSR